MISVERFMKDSSNDGSSNNSICFSDNSCLVVFYRHLRERETLYLVDYIRGREGAHDFGRAIHEGSC